MCTLSVITRDKDYLVAMNRDEKIARGAGEPLETHHLHDTAAIYPSDGAGGTWIAANAYGITLALLNWNDIVESFRGEACHNAQKESDAGSASWLRRLHASHAGGPGPFSLCVHRDDVKSLSYSEVMVTPTCVQVGHFRGSPCAMASIHPIEIERIYSLDLEISAVQ